MAAPDATNVRLSYTTPTDPLFKRLLVESVEYATGRHKLERYYEEVRAQNFKPVEVWRLALEKLRIRLDYNTQQLANIPREGPLVFIANHPFGVIDGLALSYLASQVRDNFAVLATEVLCRYEETKPFVIPIDLSGEDGALQANLNARREAIERLNGGGAILIFPAGRVSCRQGWFGAPVDLEWQRFTAKLIQQTRATVAPIFFHGQNSGLFHFVSYFSLTLRMSLLLHEVLNKEGQGIRVDIGDPVFYADVEHLDRQALLSHLRAVTYQLGQPN